VGSLALYMRSLLLLSLSTGVALRHCVPGLSTTAPHGRILALQMLAGDESVNELSGCTVVELKAKLRSQGLPVSGRKADLITRLSDSPQSAVRAPAAPSPVMAQGAPVLPSGFGLPGGAMAAEFPTIEIEACRS